MGFFDFFKRHDINEGFETYKQTKDAVLLDVRSPQEYAEGHIPESRNIPLQELERVKDKIKDRSVPLFTYCYSGSRSSLAKSLLQSLGYTNVTNIGGISSYRGSIER